MPRDYCGWKFKDRARLTLWPFKIRDGKLEVKEWDVWPPTWRVVSKESGVLAFIEYLIDFPFTWRTFWCRLRGHPHGVVWYGHGLDPDMHCCNCGDDLG